VAVRRELVSRAVAFLPTGKKTGNILRIVVRRSNFPVLPINSLLGRKNSQFLCAGNSRARARKCGPNYASNRRKTSGNGESASPRAVLAAEDAGALRIEGKEYLIQDGDVVHFRFTV